jgi:copper chaperone CopZ
MAQVTIEEVKQCINGNLGNLGSQLAQSLVKYVEGKETVLKTELTEEITKNLSGIEGLGEQLEKIQEMADAFSKAFDGNEDGKITPEEILAKAVLLQQAIDGVNGRVDAITASVADVKSAIEKELENLKGRVSALEVNTAKNSDDIAEVKANITTNYFTKEELGQVLCFEINSAIENFNKVLFPEVKTEEGDGAVE